MKFKKNGLSRITALILVFVMIFTMIPADLVQVVNAAETNAGEVAVGDGKMYLYGVTGASDAVVDENYEYYQISYTDAEVVEPVVYVGGEVFKVSEETPEIQYQFADNVIKVNKAWFDAQSLWVGVSFGVNLPEIEGITIESYNNVYNGGSYSAVEVNGKKDGDIILYSENGSAFTTAEPKVSTVNGEGKIVDVKVVRVGYEAFVSTGHKSVITAKPVDRTGIVITGNSGEYDPENAVAIKAFEVSGYDETLDKVFFSSDGGDTFTEIVKTEDGKDNIPELINAGEYKYIIKITRENHEDYISDIITANIEPASFDVSFEAYSGIYDGEGHEIIPGDIENLKDGDKVYYSVLGAEEWSETEPSVINAGSYQYEVKIERENHTPYRKRIDVVISKEEQTLKFSDNMESSVIYKEDNKIYLQVDQSVEESEVKYSLSDKTDKETNAEIKTDDDGKLYIEYTSVGQVTIIAEIEESENYNGVEPIEHTVEIKYAEMPSYEISKPVATKGENAFYTKENPLEIKSSEEGWLVSKSNALGQKEGAWKSQITPDETGSISEYKVAFKNEVGEITDYVDVVNKENLVIDVTNPSVTKIAFSDKNDGVLASIIRFLSFGIFCQKEVEIEVTVDGENVNSSGYEEVILYMYYSDGKVVSEKAEKIDEETNLGSITGTATFTIPMGFEGVIKAEVIDNAGLTSGEVLASELNSNVTDENLAGYIMIENVAPEVSEIEVVGLDEEGKEKENPRNTELTNGDETKVIYGEEFALEFTAQDEKSGLDSVVVLVNGIPYSDDEIEFPVVFNDKNNEKNTDLNEFFNINSKNFPASPDGKYVITVAAIDNAGNVTEKERIIYKDTTAPVISGYDFNTESGISNIEVEKEKEIDEITGEEIEKDYQPVDVEITDYGFYFKEKVTVTIKAEDVAAEGELVSGVESITYKCVDIEENFDEAQSVTTTVVEVEGEKQISFVIDAGFKGQIYAYATDKVGNTLENSEWPVDYKKEELAGDGIWVHPNGTVVEDADQHKITSSISISVLKNINAAGTQRYTNSYSSGHQPDQTLDYNANQMVPLYNQDVTFDVKVTDTYSGIEKVEITAINSDDSNEKVVLITDDGEVDESSDIQGWNLTKEENSNLVIGMSKEITISGNSNDIVLLVELTDNAGNTSYDYYMFGIDKKAPEVVVSYNDSPSGGDTYFNSNRTAYISLKDWNVNKDDLKVTFVKDGREEYSPNIRWNDGSTGSGHGTTYTGSFDYDGDGDYILKEVSVTDFAANSTIETNISDDENVNWEGPAPTSFTIDTIRPVISVEYNNNNETNGKYFNAHRTATIKVTEHNFDKNLVTINVTKDGARNDYSAIGWVSKGGDRYEATILYDDDADYTFDVSMKDKANNANEGVGYGNSVAPKDFTVDTTKPKANVTGVEDGKAYDDERKMVIDYSDINLQSAKIRLYRTSSEGKVEITKEFIDPYLMKASTSGKGTFDVFDIEPEIDGIYTLVIELTDKAGNVNEDQQMIFTLNRFGSVYKFEDEEYMATIQGAYLNEDALDEMKDIVLSEFNTTKLNEESIKVQITLDGKPLEADKVKFNVDLVPNDRVAEGDAGWYEYKYVISKSIFVEDGVYRITIVSTDAKGNISETENFKELEMLFRVDTTPPDITNISGLHDERFEEKEHSISVSVFDAIGLKSVTVYVNNVPVKVFENMEDAINFTGEYILTEGKDQKIEFLAVDLAGNPMSTAYDTFDPEFDFYDEVTISTSKWVLWYDNKPLFWGSIAAVVAVAGIAFWFFVIKRRKNDEEEAAS